MKGTQLRRFCYKSKANFKHHAPTILTCLGAVGVVATAVLAVKATPKALQVLEAAKDEKGEDLTMLEKINVAGPLYFPAALTGVATLACIFGSNALNRKQQAALMSAYTMLDSTYKSYQRKVRELYGEEADTKVKEALEQDELVEPEKVLFYDMHLGEYFESEVELVRYDGLECFVVNTSSIF